MVGPKAKFPCLPLSPRLVRCGYPVASTFDLLSTAFGDVTAPHKPVPVICFYGSALPEAKQEAQRSTDNDGSCISVPYCRCLANLMRRGLL